jgi:hypothetical protein
MERFRRHDESIDCDCGGRRNNVPIQITRHNETQKHKRWIFRMLSQEMLETDCKGRKVACLTVMRDLLHKM